MSKTSIENKGELCKQCLGKASIESDCMCFGTGWQIIEAYTLPDDDRTKRIRQIVEQTEKRFHGHSQKFQNKKRN